MEEEIQIEPIFMEDEESVIKVIGVGGGGGNAVNHMYNLGIRSVEFVVCNTDPQALGKSPVPKKVHLMCDSGADPRKKTAGHYGAGSNPALGKKAAEDSIEKIREMLGSSTEMVFITAGMGGGTGTGAAPVIASTAKEMGILTIAIVTIPFLFEGRKRVMQALAGVEEMRKYVDAILIINTERIKSIYGGLDLHTAFTKADNILAMAAKGIAEIITLPGYVNVDLEDVKTVMRDSGDAVMGAAVAEGEDRAITAIKESLNSPLLLSTNLNGARNILMNISYGSKIITVDELGMITDYLQEQIDEETQIIWGATPDDSLGDAISITIVATGFNLDDDAISNISNGGDPRFSTKTQTKTVVLDSGDLRFEEPRRNAGYSNPVSRPQPQAPQETKQEPNIDYKSYYGKDLNFGNSNVQKKNQPVKTVTLDLEDQDDDFESIPAFRRNKGNADEGLSRMSDISHFSLDDDDDDLSLNDKNRFLHDNVD